MTQYSVKKGLQLFCEAGKEAVYLKMFQRHKINVVRPKKANMLTHEEKSKALNYVMF
jgi:hypothetical protein